MATITSQMHISSSPLHLPRVTSPTTNNNDLREYQLITEFTKRNTNETNMSLSIYTKDNAETEQRELHGSINVMTKDLQPNSIVSTGFAMANKDDSSMWDGVKVRFTFEQDPDGAYNFDYTAQDLYFTQFIDIMSEGTAPLQGDTNSADWNVVSHKSHTHCKNDTNECLFQIHFWRAFDTGDQKQDITFVDGVDTVYKTVGFYEAQQPSGDVQKAVSNEVMISLGATTLLSTVSAVIAGLLIVTF